MAIGSGALDRKAAFFRYSEAAVRGEIAATRNALNEVVEPAPTEIDPEPVPYCSSWARREDISDGEKIAAGAEVGILRSRWTVRSNPRTRTLTERDIMIVDGETWNLKGVKESQRGAHREFLEITAVRSDRA